MYKHYDTDEHISLHDCRATKVKYEDGTISFYFLDGFWVWSENGDPTVRTDASEVRFHLESEDETDITIYVFVKKRKHTRRKEWELKKLIKIINSGKYELEFLYQYKAYHAQIFECWLWFDEKPYHMECELKMSTDKATYCWNELCKDKVW